MPTLLQPPDLAMPHGWEIFYTLLCMAAAAGALVYAVNLWRSERDLVPVLCVAAGALCVVFEPIIDVLGLCWYPRHGQWRLFETFGRPIPVLCLFGYTWFVGGMTMIVLRLLERRGPDFVWRLYPLLMLVTVPFELLANHSGVYVYYGNQPLRVFEYPVWWAPVNIGMPFVAATVIAIVRERLVGWRALGVVPIVVMAVGAVNGATAWPVWTAVNAPELPTVVVQLAGVLTIALAVSLVRFATHAVIPALVRRPANRDERAVAAA